MKVILLAALACLVSATEQPLPVQGRAFRGLYMGNGDVFSGKFKTIYLAAKHVSLTNENSQVRILMREVKYFKNYTLMSMTFYVRKDGKCQLHTIWADRLPYTVCALTVKENLLGCKSKIGFEKIYGLWVFRDAPRHFPKIYYKWQRQGGVRREPTEFYIWIHFASNTTIILDINYVNDLGYEQILTAVLATGTNITEDMWKEYVKVTKYSKIPLENIENIYEADACPKREH